MIMECNKDEAVKAKEVAESMLLEKDITGAKRFASKAQSLYPELDGLPQLLEVIHVYMAQEKKINGEEDYYGIFRVEPFSQEDVLKKQYKRLALSLHPDKNKSVGADGAFKILSQAWSILSDSDTRTAYNLKLKIILNQIGVGNPHCVPTQPSTQGTSTANGAYVVPRFPAPHINNQHLSSGNPHSIPIYQPTPARPPFHPHPYAPFTNRPTFVIPPSRPMTFWTMCTKCKMGFEYKKIYLNENLLCCICQLPFLATQMPHAPNVNAQRPCPWGFSRPQQHVFTRVSQSAPIPEKMKANAAPIPEKMKADAAPIPEEMKAASVAGGPNKENSVKKRHTKDEASGSRSGVKRASNSKKELSQAELRGVLVTKGKMRVLGVLNEGDAEESKKSSHMKGVEIKDAINLVKTEQSGDGLSREPKSTSQPKKSPTLEETDELEVNADETVSMIVPDANFHNFDDGRIESSFSENQIWAAYDDDDGMPRYYALVHSIISRKPFKMQISWLNSKSSSEYGSLDWIGSGFTKTSGEYRVGKCVVSRRLNSFSHSVKWKKGPRGVIQLFPTKGDVWAVYRNWSLDWVEATTDEILHKYDVVAVLEDYNEEIGVVIAPLLKVAGFTSVFNLDQTGIRTIPREEMFRFSHQVPFYILTGTEAENVQQGFYELDPAALPLELLQVITDAEVAEERVSEQPIVRSGSEEAASESRVGSTSSGKSHVLQKRSGLEDDNNILTYSRRKKRKEDGKNLVRGRNSWFLNEKLYLVQLVTCGQLEGAKSPSEWMLLCALILAVSDYSAVVDAAIWGWLSHMD